MNGRDDAARVNLNGGAILFIERSIKQVGLHYKGMAATGPRFRWLVELLVVRSMVE